MVPARLVALWPVPAQSERSSRPSLKVGKRCRRNEARLATAAGGSVAEVVWRAENEDVRAECVT